MLILVATTGIMAGVAQQYTSQVVRREKEAELLFRGEQYVNAIKSYYLAGRQLPTHLSDLASDPRFLRKPHIRQLYPDPFATGEDRSWAVILNDEGRIVGVASKSNLKPIKTDNFPRRFSKFTGATKYSDWKFVFDPKVDLLLNKRIQTQQFNYHNSKP